MLRSAGIDQPVRHGLITGLDALRIPHDLNTGDLVGDVQRFMRRSAHHLKAWPADPAPRVLFFSVRAMSPHIPYDTGIMAHGIRLRGGCPEIVLCDDALPACESVAITDYAHWPEFLDESRRPVCARCFAPSSRLLRAFALPFRPLSQYVSAEMLRQAADVARSLSLDEVLSFRDGAVDVGEHVRTSLYRFWLSGTLDDDERGLAIARKFLATGIAVGQAARRILEEIEPDCVVSHHGIYLIGGSVSAVARNMGVRVVAWDTTYRRNTIIASHGETYHYALRSEPCDAWQDAPLSEDQEHRLDYYLASRRGGGLQQDYVSYHPRPISGRERVMAALGLDTDRRRVILFTNVAWDGRVHVPDGLFAGPVEWVTGTLRYLANRTDLQVVVRIHPAEVKHGLWIAQQRMDDEIKKVFPCLPPNVVVVPPESDINSYTLAELADVGVVYSTKMGLEAALMGVPLIIAGDAFYGNKGFGRQPRDIQEYHALLDRPGELARVSEGEMVRVRRYAYYYYFRRALPLPTVVPNPHTPWAPTLTHFLPEQHAGLDAVCNGVLAGTPFRLDE